MEQLVSMITEDLRLALLLIGVVLLLGIVLWELLQRRRVKRAEREVLKGPLGVARERSPVAEAVDPLFRSESAAVAEQQARREEPALKLPQISTRDRLIEPPLIDLDAAMQRPGTGPGLPVMQAASNAGAAAEAVEALGSVASPGDDARPIEQAVESSVSEAGSDDGAAAVNVAASAAPRLELPAEERRVIVALRVVARGGERFSGASLRQALHGEGFVHGDMGIFHRAVGDGRVLLSAASLTKPGSFDLDTMDSSVFLGINVFAVLPGPLPGRDTVDKLLLAGHTLAQRLKGELHDSKGQPLTEARLAEMRREAAAAATAG